MARSIYYFTDSDVYGGAEQALFILIQALDRSQWQPTLLLPESPALSALTQRAESLDVPVRAVPALPLGSAGARRLPEFAGMLGRERPDVFHASLPSPLSAKFALAGAVLARIPAVVGTVQLVPPFPISRPSRLQLRALVSHVGRILAVSEGIRTTLVDELRWPAEKIQVIYNGVVPLRADAPAAEALRNELTAGREMAVVMVTARLDEQKGHDILLQAAARLPNAMFIIAGDGPERARLEALASQLGVEDRVRFLGQREDVDSLLGACDVFALPSLYEGSSLSVLEAMSAGRAVVTSDIPGTNELVQDGQTGLLTPPGNPAALAGALDRVLADPELRQRLGERAQDRVRSNFTAAATAQAVTSVYEELLAGQRSRVAHSPDSSGLNDRLRAGDWRFLLGQPCRPVARSLARGRLAEATALVTDPPPNDGIVPDLVVLSRPAVHTLRRARAVLRPGGELLAHWALPRLGGTGSMRRVLTRTGFHDVRLYWPGPNPARPEFWLELGSQAARAHVLAQRPARNLRTALLRLGWHVAVRAGIVAPVFAVARAAEDDLDGGFPLPALPAEEPRNGSVPAEPELLLTGGGRAINKAVGVKFAPGSEDTLVVKFARVPEADPGLSREVDVLRRLAEQNPDLAGVPRVLGVGQRAGRMSVAESALQGRPMLGALRPESFPALAAQVTDWLLALAGRPDPLPREAWWDRLVQRSLEAFAVQFGSVLEPSVLEAIADRLGVLDSLPEVFEHRDCSPWNILLTESGTPALVDWESAEPRGLPCLDLVYFLANSVFILDGAIASGTTRTSYRRLLDEAHPYGRVAASCVGRYCLELGVEPALVPGLRLLTWIIHARSDYRHLELEGRAEPERLRLAPFLGLVLEELECPAG